MRFLIDLLSIFAVPHITIQKDGHGGKGRTGVIDGGSGRMKLIIDIPEDIYDGLINDRGVVIPSYWHEYVADLCKNGTPLDDVKADIKTYSIIKQNPIANRKVKADSIEVWKAKIIEKEHIKELLDKIRAEIDEQYDRVRPYNIYVAEGLEMALEIINIYNPESEGANGKI